MSSNFFKSLAWIFGEHQIKTVDKLEIKLFECVTLECEDPLFFPVVNVETIVL